MKKAKIIFGSRSELKAYKKIEEHLPDNWNIYPNIPLSQIVEIGKTELNEKKWNFYLKASVDFVITDHTHEPTLAVEFDGLGGGYSSGGTYIPKQVVERDPYRKLKLDFKINTCSSVGLPLIVISFEEINSLLGEDLFSLVNSMVGQHIASRVYDETIEKWDKEGRGEGKSYDEILWETCDLRAELDCKYDPLMAELEKDWEEYSKLGVKMSMYPLFKPDILTTMREKKAFESVGYRYVAKGGDLSIPVILAVWVRNFAGHELKGFLSPDLPISHGINPLQVAYNATWYLGQKKVVEMSRTSSR